MKETCAHTYALTIHNDRQPCGGQKRTREKSKIVQSNEAWEGHHNGPCHAMPDALSMSGFWILHMLLAAVSFKTFTCTDAKPRTVLLWCRMMRV